MNIHELTQRVYGVVTPEYWQEKHVNRLLCTSLRALGVDSPGRGFPVNVDEGTAQFVCLLHLLAEDSPSYGSITRLTQDQMAEILVEAGAETAVPGDLLVIEFRGGYHTADIYSPEPKRLAAAFRNIDNGVTSYRIVKVP